MPNIYNGLISSAFFYSKSFNNDNYYFHIVVPMNLVGGKRTFYEKILNKNFQENIISDLKKSFM
jgi:hypothetical protein